MKKFMSVIFVCMVAVAIVFCTGCESRTTSVTYTNWGETRVCTSDGYDITIDKADDYDVSGNYNLVSVHDPDGGETKTTMRATADRDYCIDYVKDVTGQEITLA